MNAAGPGRTGTAGCVSDIAAFDMVGNIWEWVADRVPLSSGCVPPLFTVTGDANCLAGASTTEGPAAILRGGDFGSVNAGVFAVSGRGPMVNPTPFFGFRAARP